MRNAQKISQVNMQTQLTTKQLCELDKRHLWHPFTPMKLWLESDPLVITDASGMHLIDSDGKRYLDGVSSLWCNVHGHRVPELDRAITDQLQRVAHTSMLGLASEPAILLADRLMKIVPQNLKKVFYSDSGATATEIAFKLAAQYWFNIGRPEKCEFVGFTEAYHGDTIGAMSVGRTDAFHRPYFPLLFKVHFAPTPFAYRFQPMCNGENDVCRTTSCAPDSPIKTQCLTCLEQILQTHHSTLAAVCIEPIVQGAAGMIVHPPGFLRGVRDLCDKYEVLMICDEVATGFGRTGKMFAVEHEDVRPDLMCVAKGITGGYLPLAATFATQAIFDAFLGDPWEGKTFFHGHTYTGNPLACAVAIASLDLFESNQVLDRVREKEKIMTEYLPRFLDLAHVGDVRFKGCMFGIELVRDKESRARFDPKCRIGHKLCLDMRSQGVLLRNLGDVIVLMPPPAMNVEDFRTIVTVVVETVGRMS